MDHDADPQPLPQCTLDATAFRERRARLRRVLARRVGETTIIPGGWALRFERRADTIAELAERLGLEAACCPFLGLRLDVEPEPGAVWLRVIGLEAPPAWLGDP